jgi:hypothetical protein
MMLREESFCVTILPKKQKNLFFIPAIFEHDRQLQVSECIPTLSCSLVTTMLSSGELVEDESNYLKVVPARFEMKGNYGVSIHWSDGHCADIFPFSVLRRIVTQDKSSQTSNQT